MHIMIEEHTLPDGASGPYGIGAVPDGALWFTEMRGGRIGRITTGVRSPLIPSRPGASRRGGDGATALSHEARRLAVRPQAELDEWLASRE